MQNLLVSNLLPPAIALVIGVHLWYRTGFRTPRVLRLSARVPRRTLIASGWALILGISVKSVGGLFGDGRVQIRQSGQRRRTVRENHCSFGERLRVSYCWLVQPG